MNEYEVGRVISVANNIITANNLHHASFGSRVEIGPHKKIGYISKISEIIVYISCLYPTDDIKPNDEIICHNKPLTIKVSREILGRVIDPLGRSCDGLASYHATSEYLLQGSRPALMNMRKVQEPMHTGVKVVDALVPIGRGQRELIIGDRQTGKTQIALEAIINQAAIGTICVYVATNKKRSIINNILYKLEKKGVRQNLVIVYTAPNSTAAMHIQGPLAGTAICEYFRDRGHHCLVVYDDLLKHAWAYRQNAVLLENPVGREAYPSGIFYLHAQLLERSANIAGNALVSNEKKSITASITALPIIETQESNFADYITTNIVSITDGQIILSAQLFNKGFKPAIDPGNSVSRAGGAAQSELIRSLSKSIRLTLSQYKELESFTKFTSDLDENTAKLLLEGEITTRLMNQSPFEKITPANLAITLFCIDNKLFNSTKLSYLEEYAQYVYFQIKNHYPDMYNRMNDVCAKALNTAEQKMLIKLINKQIASKSAEINSL